MKASLIKSLMGWVLAAILIMGPCLRRASAGVAVAPLKQEISLKPGEEGKVTLTLVYVNRTQTETSQKMQLALSDVQTMEDGSLVFKDAGTQATSASKWISLNQQDIDLEPGKSQPVECTIKVPMSAASGEYYSVVMVTMAQKGVNEKGVSVQYRIASGVFVTVLGRTFPKEAKITQCELIWPQNAATQPAATQVAGTQPAATQPESAAKEPDSPTVRVVLQNTGQARFDASGKITVYDDQTRLVLSAPLNSKRLSVFGGDSRLFTAPITKALAAGKYTIRVEMDYQSTWAKARQEMQVEVLPSQAELLAQLKNKERQQSAAIEASVPSMQATLPPGATRTLAIALKDVSEGTVTCQASTTTPTVGAESWFSVATDPFTITKGSKKTLVLKVEVPATAAAGKYSSNITVDANVEGSGSSQVVIPVDIDVKAGR